MVDLNGHMRLLKEEVNASIANVLETAYIY